MGEAKEAPVKTVISGNKMVFPVVYAIKPS